MGAGAWAGRPSATGRARSHAGPAASATAGAWLRHCVLHEIENRRLFPWLAVAYGLGILLAFAADGPLSLAPPLVAASGAGALAYLGRAHLGRWIVLVGAAGLFVGFATAALRLWTVEAPILQRQTVTPIEGFVETVEERAAGGGRIVLRVTRMDKVEEATRPPRIRVTLRSLDGVGPGDHVAGTARLLPPPEAARPGGYDFARDAYFRGLGAVGSISGKLKRADPPSAGPDLSLRVAAMIDRARNALTTRIAATIGGQAGAVSAALVTGKRGLIDERTNDILRAAGIYHVVSISGLHMVLAAGVFFWVSRSLLALSPALALGWPIKKIAAAIGMAGATGYCIFSGAEVATERSLVMILVMQGAILFDRPALSLRNLAISAILVLAREPEALLGPSFQMSYAAVAGLIALAEALRRLRSASEPGDPIRRAALWLGAVVLGTVATTLVATVATAPFGTYHFQNLQPYGLIGNAATLPLVSLAVMPAAVLGVVALPFGLDRPVWTAMGWATEGVLRLSEWVSGFPSSTVITPAFGAGALALFAAAILCVTLLGSGLRLIGAAPALLGLWFASGPERPDIYVARDGAGAAVRTQDGRLSILGRVSAFTAEQWLKADGDGRKATDPSLKALARCDRIGCTAVLPDGRAVSYLADRRGFAEDCGRAAIVISRLAAPAGCGALTVLDRAHLVAHGATALFVRPTGLAMDTVRRPGETRPWFVKAEVAPPARERPVSRSRDEPAPPTRPSPVAPDEDLPPVDQPGDEP